MTTKLRGKKPTTVEKRLKALFYGVAGAGKTTAAISFPRVYLIDTERGAENDTYVKTLEAGGGVIFQTSSFDDLVSEVKLLLTEEHEYKTLVIDPLTTLYNDLLDKAALKVGTEFGRHYGEANKSMKHLLSLLTRLDMNVIITSHAKNEYGANLAVLGTTFDCYKKLDYLFDLCIEIQKHGKERLALIKKTRIATFPEGDIFPFSYAEVAKRYGQSVLERDTVAQVLASPEQVERLKSLIENVKLEEGIVEKWLTKAQAETLEEMPADTIQKCIEYLLEKVQVA